MTIRITNPAPDQPIQDPPIHDAGQDIDLSRTAEVNAPAMADAGAAADDRTLVLRGSSEVKVSTRIVESSWLFSALFSFLHLFEARPKLRIQSEAPPKERDVPVLVWVWRKNVATRMVSTVEGTSFRSASPQWILVPRIVIERRS